ncbi:GNAT family N-acetyltransferase [Herbiconiux sp. SYSU D00978]|uniref:GNAT family N-acetyltransferase n=1 Tax=Herbiconiux sp. SYSU D00978 TaxID=2812562 RepID=UPI001A97946F|nr:GNAT family N-acetyltransferase [Herbiconiux sp. SYSU D00978]
MSPSAELTLRPAAAADHPRLLAVWRAAVEATHAFLTPADIEGYAARMLPEFLPAVDLVVAERDGVVVGFRGMAGHRIEMLFVDPAEHGRGVGTALLDDAARSHPVVDLDVNEQNPGAREFYRRRGFVEVGRSPVDGEGRPFPVVHLRREADVRREAALGRRFG